MQTVIVDDRDPRITYTGGSWFNSGNPRIEWNGTTHATNTPGSSFVFTFTGTSVSVFGTLTQHVIATIRSSYTLDGGTTADYTAPSNLSDVGYHTLFYTSPDVSYGNHTLTVSVDVAGPVNTYWLDYITYNIPPPNTTIAFTSPASARPSSSFAPLSNSSLGGNSTPALGVVIPAIIIPICGTLLLVLAGFWYLVKRRREDPERGMSDDAGSTKSASKPKMWDITPFPISYSGSSSRSSGRSSTRTRWGGDGRQRTSNYSASPRSNYSVLTDCEPARSRVPISPPMLPPRAISAGFDRDFYDMVNTPPAYARSY